MHCELVFKKAVPRARYYFDDGGALPPDERRTAEIQFIHLDLAGRLVTQPAELGTFLLSLGACCFVSSALP